MGGGGSRRWSGEVCGKRPGVTGRGNRVGWGIGGEIEIPQSWGEEAALW